MNTKEYYLKNKEKLNLQSKIYKLENIDKILESNYEYKDLIQEIIPSIKNSLLEIEDKSISFSLRSKIFSAFKEEFGIIG